MRDELLYIFHEILLYLGVPVADHGCVSSREMVNSPNAISPKVISPNVFGHFA